MKQISQNTLSKNWRITTYLVSAKTTDTHVIEKYLQVNEKREAGEWVEEGRYKRTSRQQKLLAVDGCLAGQRITPKQAETYGYHRYNFAEFNRGVTRRTRTRDIPTAVYLCF